MALYAKVKIIQHYMLVRYSFFFWTKFSASGVKCPLIASRLTPSTVSFKLSSAFVPLVIIESWHHSDPYLNQFMSQKTLFDEISNFPVQQYDFSWLPDLAHLQQILKATWSCSWCRSETAKGCSLSGPSIICELVWRLDGFTLAVEPAVVSRTAGWVMTRHGCLEKSFSLWCHLACRQLLLDVCISVCYLDGVSTC